MLTLGLTSQSEPEGANKVTWIYLPAAKGQIDRAIFRSGITDPKDMCFWNNGSEFIEEIDAALDFGLEDIYALNDLAQAVDRLSQEDRVKLGAVITMAKPEYASQIQHLAENLDQFEFVPGAHTPAEYGKYMIQVSTPT